MVPEWIRVIEIDGYSKMKTEIMDPPLQVAKRYFFNRELKNALSLAILHTIFKISHDRTAYYKYVLRNIKIEGEYDTAIAYCGPFDFLTVMTLYYINAKKRIQWVHFDVSKFHFNVKMCKRLYQHFDDIFVVSDEAKKELLSVIPEIRNKTKTVHNVISKSQCEKLAEQGNGFVDSVAGKRIVTVGRLSEEKGQDIIPVVARKLKEQGCAFKWYLIGDGKLKNKIEQLAKDNNVQHEIVFLGAQINPYQFLKNADLYVQTSIHEGFCITLGEAKVFGMPIISTEFAGAHEQLDGQRNCLVVQRDATILCDAIMKYMKG